MRTSHPDCAERLIAVALALLLCTAAGCVTHPCATQHAPVSTNHFQGPFPFTPAAGVNYPLWRTASGGNPILLLHPLPGLDPDTLEFALLLESKGYRVYFPDLYGGAAFGLSDASKAKQLIRRGGRWHPESMKDPGPILDDLRTLVERVSDREGGQSLTVLGNCGTGILPLALLAEARVHTAVLCQPATPLISVPEAVLGYQRTAKREALGLSSNSLQKTFRALAQHPEKRIIGLHYQEDPIGAFDKFPVLRRALDEKGLADRFHVGVLHPVGSQRPADWLTRTSGTLEPRRILSPHSTLTARNRSDRDWFRNYFFEELSYRRP